MWCPRPDSNRHGIASEDFKSLASTDFATRARVQGGVILRQRGHRGGRQEGRWSPLGARGGVSRDNKAYAQGPDMVLNLDDGKTTLTLDDIMPIPKG
jgi:hypothetical protein